MAQEVVAVHLADESRLMLEKLGRVEVMSDIRKALYAGTAEAVPAVRAKIRAMPSTKGRRTKTSLRSQLAMAVGRKVKTTGKTCYVAIIQHPRGGYANLARAVEGEIPWQHPVYGYKPDVKEAPYPFFYDTLEKLYPQLEIEMDTALADIDRKM
jgi:hypothetical protein